MATVVCTLCGMEVEADYLPAHQERHERQERPLPDQG